MGIQNTRLYLSFYLDLEVNIKGLVGVAEVLPELLVEILRHADVLEHPLEFASVLEAARLLELRNHGGLGVVAGGHMLHQPLGQHLAIKLLEHILVLNVFEDDHLEKAT